MSINDIPNAKSNPLGELHKHPKGADIQPHADGKVSSKSGRASPIHPGMTRQQRSAYVNDVPLASYPDASSGSNPLAPEPLGKNFKAAPVHAGMQSQTRTNGGLGAFPDDSEDKRIDQGRRVWAEALRDGHDEFAHAQSMDHPDWNE